MDIDEFMAENFDLTSDDEEETSDEEEETSDPEGSEEEDEDKMNVKVEEDDESDAADLDGDEEDVDRGDFEITPGEKVGKMNVQIEDEDESDNKDQDDCDEDLDGSEKDLGGSNEDLGGSDKDVDASDNDLDWEDINEESDEDTSSEEGEPNDDNTKNNLQKSQMAVTERSKDNISTIKTKVSEDKPKSSTKKNKQDASEDSDGSAKQIKEIVSAKGFMEESGEGGKKQSAIDKHKKSIESLKEKDPDFYQFLQENDTELLNFDDDDDSDGDDDDDELEEEESDSDDEGAVHKLPDKLEEASEGDSESDEENIKSSKITHKGITVTIAMVDKWGDQMQDNNVQAFRELVEAFTAAVRGMPDEEEEEVEMKYKVQGSRVFNAIVSLCLKGVHPMLEGVLKMDSNAVKRLALPSSGKGWKTVQNDVRDYLLQLTQLLSHMVDSAIVYVVLQHIHKMIPYYCSYPKMTRSLIKKLVPLWSAGEETVRVVAFLGLFSITRYMKKPNWLEFILKQMYMAYVKNTKFTSPSTLPLINFMQRSLTEMFAINTQITYQHAFVYIRQLAIHLRNAITIKKDQFQSVYNWQYVHCVWLWCRVLGTLHLDQTLQPLIYPLVQTAVGVIKLIPAAKYIPLHFSIVRALNILSEATETFIPLLPHILDVFNMVDFNKRPVGVSYRPLNFAVMLKLSTKQLAEKGFKDGLMDEIYELILEHLVIHSHTISFPELALPVILKMKEFIKGSRVPAYSKLMKGLLDKIQENCRQITQKRDTVTFGIADDQAVRTWESKMKDQGTFLSKHYNTYKPLRERELKTEEAGKDRLLDLNFPTIAREKKRKMKDEDKEDFKELFERDSDSEDDILVRAERKEQRKKEEKKAGRGKRRRRHGDDVESDSSDFDMSDDDDDDKYDDDSYDDDENDDDSSDDSGGEDEKNTSDDDNADEADLGSDGDGKVHTGIKSFKNGQSQRTQGKEPLKIVEVDTVDHIQDVVEDFQLWSDGEVGEESEGKKCKKRKFKKGKSGKKKQGAGFKKSKKAKLEGKA